MFRRKKKEGLQSFGLTQLKLQKAIESRNAIALQELLTPTLLQQADLLDRNILHLVAKNGSFAQLKMVCEFIIRLKRINLFLKPDNFGNTPLHYLAGHNTLDTVFYFLNNVLGKTASYAAKIVNDINQWPIDLVKKNSHQPDHSTIIQLLEEMMIIHDLPGISTPIVRDEKSEHAGNSNELMTFFTRIANQARKDLPVSTTHPSLNTQYDLRRIYENLKKMRSSVAKELTAQNGKRKLMEKELKEITFDVIRDYIKEEKAAQLHLHVVECNVAKQEKTGNCVEFSLMVHLSILQERPDLRAEVYGFPYERGDHAFNIINRDPLSHPNDPTTGGDFYFIDSWSGKIGRGAQALLNSIQYYRRYKGQDILSQKFNVSGPINIYVHPFTPIYCSHSIIETLVSLPQEKKQRYLEVADMKQTTTAHAFFRQSTMAAMQIFFKQIDEMKDEQFCKKILQAHDTNEQTPLHEIAQNRDYKAVRYLLNEYQKRFTHDLASMLLEAKSETSYFLRNLLAHCNNNAIQALYNHYKNDNETRNALNTKMRNIFLSYVQTPLIENMKAFYFLTHKANIITLDDLQAAFVASDKTSMTHAILWAACKKKLSPDDQKKLLAHHPQYKEIIELHQLLLRKKNAILALKPGNFFVRDARAHAKRVKLLSTVPDSLMMNEKLEWDFSLKKLDEIRQGLFSMRRKGANEAKETNNRSIDCKIQL